MANNRLTLLCTIQSLVLIVLFIFILAQIHHKNVFVYVNLLGNKTRYWSRDGSLWNLLQIWMLPLGSIENRSCAIIRSIIPSPQLTRTKRMWNIQDIVVDVPWRKPWCPSLPGELLNPSSGHCLQASERGFFIWSVMAPCNTCKSCSTEGRWPSTLLLI